MCIGNVFDCHYRTFPMLIRYTYAQLMIADCYVLINTDVILPGLSDFTSMLDSLSNVQFSLYVMDVIVKLVTAPSTVVYSITSG